MAEHDSKLVPDRICGACNVCCDVLPINEPELKKVPGVLCEHCDPGKGCQIYDRRPSVCRGWHCGWRFMAGLGEEWRPDNSNILLKVVTEGIPSGYPQQGVSVVLLNQDLRRIFWTPLLNLIADLVGEGVPTFVSTPGPPGYYAREVFLNASEKFQEAIRNRDQKAFVADLSGAFKACLEAPCEKADF